MFSKHMWDGSKTLGWFINLSLEAYMLNTFQAIWAIWAILGFGPKTMR